MSDRVMVIRDVTPKESRWLKVPVLNGTVLFKFRRNTFGTITSTGAAVSKFGTDEYPFFELPVDALVDLPENPFTGMLAEAWEQGFNNESMTVPQIMSLVDAYVNGMRARCIL